MSRSPYSKTFARRWWVLLALAGTFVSTGLVALVLIMRECGKEEFCAKLAALLSRQMKAEVVVWPMRSHSLLFVDCPLIQVKDPAGRWAFRAQHLSFELLPSSILAGGLGFRSVQVQEAELWLGEDPGQPREPEWAELEGDASRKSTGLPWWLEGRLRDLGHVPMDSIAISKLRVRGPETRPEQSALELTASLTGQLRDRCLHWRIEEGQVEIPGQPQWRVEEFSGVWGKTGPRVNQGLLVSSTGAEISCRSQDEQAPGDLTLDVKAQGVTFHPSRAEVEDALGPISRANASVNGVLCLRFPEVQRFQFSGDFELDGLDLGQSRVFRLLSGQTGEEKLQRPQARKLTGRIDSSPGVTRLTRLNLTEKGLFRLEGWLSMMAEDVLGVFDLALPAPMVGRIPGGKPKGFSYPASGWSWARFRVDGKCDKWQEDLSERLMAQISRDIPVKAGPAAPSNPGPLEAGPTAKVPTQEEFTATQQRRQESLERLFYSLIGD